MANRTKLTLKKRKEFIELLKENCNVTISARTIGVSRSQLYIVKEKNAKFSEQWDEAIEEAVELLEYEARERALNGTGKPVYYKGKRCGTVQEYSDSLMMFLLKAHRPEKYKERSEVTGKGGLPVIPVLNVTRSRDKP